MKKQDFEFLTSLLRQYAGWDFDEEQYFVVDKKISNFIREKNYPNVEDLIDELKLGSRALIGQVVESLALSETSFYRDYDVFQRFENILLPNLRENNRATKKIRFWSLGCSTGQEAYSIAMAVRNTVLGLSDWNIEILGSDLSAEAINIAQKGIYNNFEIQTGLNAKSILKFFHQEGSNWVVNDDLRNMINFRRYNLLEDITFSNKFDVIFCRNVLRFFSPEYQRLLLAKISSYQAQGGVLYLGKNEHLDGIDDFYNKLPGFNCVYVSKVTTVAQDVAIQKVSGEAPVDVMPSFVRPSGLM